MFCWCSVVCRPTEQIEDGDVRIRLDLRHHSQGSLDTANAGRPSSYHPSRTKRGRYMRGRRPLIPERALGLSVGRRLRVESYQAACPSSACPSSTKRTQGDAGDNHLTKEKLYAPCESRETTVSPRDGKNWRRELVIARVEELQKRPFNELFKKHSQLFSPLTFAELATGQDSAN